MLRVLIACLALVLTVPLASAQERLAPNPAIETTIQNQFDAFLDRDVGEAWQYASPNIQSLFGSPENFGRMVEQGYPMVWTPGRVEFIDLQSLGGILVQRVEVIDQAGTAHYLGYQMIETGEGWRINGVQVLRAPQVGA
ncbi:DUF4864 domain-containing protein [Roseibacterium sp. SDUM158016]|jgi:hypothetical protein|uniref:DUF4864 domain-containing protein n=1 Tax=Roseicyclus sediminis TaxID=2980997 RepID=UPI0021D0AC85|nr:DUF4864 domain-containing protein [Roseibacterium sp. SDUM158016]MCU4655031.1 DUF4864 domain-containing protein [Roseibacterium sp. SDUM158016]